MDEFVKVIEAAKQGTEEDVRAVVQSHPELINKRDELGVTPLHHAALEGHRASGKDEE